MPSELASDEVFVRRAYLDLTGTLPTPNGVVDFVSDKDAKKRDALVDHLVDSPEYSYFFANKWADILRVKRGRDGNSAQRAQGTFAFHDWIREAMANDKPYDEFVRDILERHRRRDEEPANGLVQGPAEARAIRRRHRPGVPRAADCLRELSSPSVREVEPGRLLGTWPRSSAALARSSCRCPAFRTRQALQIIYTRPDGTVTNKRTQKPAVIKPLDGAPMEIERGDDPRQKLVDWMVDPKNPFFARAVANRYWAHFFGRGIVDPIDDMRVTNPPTNPELLDALAKVVIDSKFSLKTLVKTIAKSRTYQLSAIPNEFNKHDKQTYARYYPKRMSAEVLLDAVCQVTDSPTQFGGLPQDRFAPKRAIMLPDESFNSYFLDVFGRPQRISACECERVSDANLAQALHLLNSDEIQGKLTRQNGRADTLGERQGHPLGCREDRGIVHVGLWPQTDCKRFEDLAGAHREAQDEQKDRLREYLVGVDQHEGVRVYSVTVGRVELLLMGRLPNGPTLFFGSLQISQRSLLERSRDNCKLRRADRSWPEPAHGGVSCNRTLASRANSCARSVLQRRPLG